MYDRLLTTHRPEFAKYGVGLDVNFEVRHSQNGSQQVKNGFVLNSAAVTAAVAMPVASVPVAMPAAQEMHRGENYGAATVVPLNNALPQLQQTALGSCRSPENVTH